MLQKFKEIINAWVIAKNPTTEQKILAEKRYNICDTCPSKKTITSKLEIGVVCGECGCPITKKIFSTEINACPLKKWKEIDDEFHPPTQKKVKTFL
jgi:hypothetical protein